MCVVALVLPFERIIASFLFSAKLAIYVAHLLAKMVRLKDECVVHLAKQSVSIVR